MFALYDGIIFCPSTCSTCYTLTSASNKLHILHIPFFLDDFGHCSDDKGILSFLQKKTMEAENGLVIGKHASPLQPLTQNFPQTIMIWKGKTLGKHQPNAGVFPNQNLNALDASMAQMFTDLMDKKTPPPDFHGIYVDMLDLGVQISLNLRKITIIPKVLNLNDQGIWRKKHSPKPFHHQNLSGKFPTSGLLGR